MKHGCKVQTYERVMMPTNATQQFDNYGREIAPGCGGQDDFESDDDEMSNPYQDNYVIGDLNRLFLEEGEKMDPQIERLNKEEHRIRSSVC